MQLLHLFFSFFFVSLNYKYVLVKAEKCFWGSFRPNVLIGLRASNSRSLVTGVAWSTTPTGPLQHFVPGFKGNVEWLAHDGCSFGIQNIIEDAVAEKAEEKTTESILKGPIRLRTSFLIKASVPYAPAPVHSDVKLPRLSRTSVAPSCSSDGLVVSMHQSISIFPLQTQTPPPEYLRVLPYFALEDDTSVATLDFLPAWGAKTMTLQLAGVPHQAAFLTGCSGNPRIGSFLIAIFFPNDAPKRHPKVNDQTSLPRSFSFLRTELNKPRLDSAILMERLVRDFQEKTIIGDTVFSTFPNKGTNLTKAHIVALQILVSMQRIEVPLTMTTHLFTSKTCYDHSEHHGKPCSFLQQHGLASCDKAEASSMESCVKQLEQFLQFDGWFSSSMTPGVWMNKTLEQRSVAFQNRLSEVFPTRPKHNNLNGDAHDSHRFELVRYGVSNLLGGYGYFYGSLRIRVPSYSESSGFSRVFKAETPPLEIFSGTPSRPHFPRPFLWDEGFHLEITRRWNLRLFFQSLSTWLRLQFHATTHNYIYDVNAQNQRVMQALQLDQWNGWIPRELCLGREGRESVPESFQAQDVQVANPPTLILPLLDHVNAVSKGFLFLSDPTSGIASDLIDLRFSLQSLLEEGRGENVSSSILWFVSPFSWAHYSSEKPGSSTRWDALNREAQGAICMYNRLPFFFVRQQCLAPSDAFSEVVQHTAAFLRDHYRHIVQWYDYFNRTQRSQLRTTKNDSTNTTVPLFRWRDQTSNHGLGSGLDDYPRGWYIASNQLHLDLQSWMAMFAQGIARLCRFGVMLGLPLDKNECDGVWPERAAAIEAAIWHPSFTLDPVTQQLHSQRLFYSPKLRMLTDNLGDQWESKLRRKTPLLLPPWRPDGRCGMDFRSLLDPSLPGPCNPYDGQPCCSPSGWCGSTPEYCHCSHCLRFVPIESAALSSNSPWSALTTLKLLPQTMSPHIGYVNVLPLCMHLFPTFWSERKPLSTSSERNEVFNLLLTTVRRIHSSLVSPAGLRSLSNSSVLYHTQEDYWRGDVWLPMNYLILKTIKKFYLNDSSSTLQVVPHFQAALLSPRPSTVTFVLKTELISAMQTLYKETYNGVTSAVVDEFKRSKKLWERYSDLTRAGKGVTDFTGWTSLIVLLLNPSFSPDV